MNNVNNTLELFQRQQLIRKVEELAVKVPGMGINLQQLQMLPTEVLIGIFNFLRRIESELEA